MDLNETLASYGASWNEPDAEKRRALLDESWADDGVFVDPTGRAEGRDALLDMISGFQQMFPGSTIDLTSGIDTHANVFRFTWVIRDAGGNVTLEGIDFGELAPDGRIANITGFWGPLPELP